MVKTPEGGWRMWRVGRHRLAWRPIPRAPWQARWYRYDPAGPRINENFDMFNWLVALLATLVVLPWRAITNRWPVIAYVIDAEDGNSRQCRTRPMPRAAADALARKWAEHIKRHGEPPPSSSSA